MTSYIWFVPDTFLPQSNNPIMSLSFDSIMYIKLSEDSIKINMCLFNFFQYFSSKSTFLKIDNYIHQKLIGRLELNLVIFLHEPKIFNGFSF